MVIVIDRWAASRTARSVLEQVSQRRLSQRVPALRGMTEVSLGTDQVTVALEQDCEVVMCVRIAKLCAGTVGSFRSGVVPKDIGVEVPERNHALGFAQVHATQVHETAFLDSPRGDQQVAEVCAS